MNLSGLSAIQTALQVSANNLANSVTPGFEPSHVIFQAGPTGQVRAHVEHPRNSRPGSDTESDASTPSGTDVAEEMVELIQLRSTYSANLKAFRAQDGMLGLLINTRA